MISVETARTLLAGFAPRDELVQFARALKDEQGSEFDWLYFLEKPWQWAQEYKQWVDSGRPDTGFLYPEAQELDVDMEAARTAFLAETVGIPTPERGAA